MIRPPTALRQLGTLLFALLNCSMVLPALADINSIDSKVGASTFVFECNDRQRFVLRSEQSLAWLFTSIGTLRLERSYDSTTLVYHNKDTQIELMDQNAIIRFPAQTPLRCKNNRRAAIWEHAKLNGADFRAVGNEPGWQLLIMAAEKMILVSDYGHTRIEQALPEALSDPDSRTTRWMGDRFELEVSGRSCIDDMSGEQFESTVTVYLDEQALKGCGRALH